MSGTLTRPDWGAAIADLGRRVGILERRTTPAPAAAPASSSVPDNRLIATYATGASHIEDTPWHVTFDTPAVTGTGLSLASDQMLQFDTAGIFAVNFQWFAQFEMLGDGNPSRGYAQGSIQGTAAVAGSDLDTVGNVFLFAPVAMPGEAPSGPIAYLGGVVPLVIHFDAGDLLDFVVSGHMTTTGGEIVGSYAQITACQLA